MKDLPRLRQLIFIQFGADRKYGLFAVHGKSAQFRRACQERPGD